MREAIRRHQTPAGRCRRRTGIHTRGTAATQSDAIRRNQTQSDVPASIRREELQRGVRVGGGEPGGLLQPPSDRIELRSSLGGCGGRRVARTPQGALCRAPLHRLWREGEARDLRLVGGLGVAKGLREGGIGAAEGGAGARRTDAAPVTGECAPPHRGHSRRASSPQLGRRSAAPTRRVEAAPAAAAAYTAAAAV